MLLNEHKSKTLFEQAGVAVPTGITLDPESLETVVPDFEFPWILKAQVLAGGRGKAGGVLRVDDKQSFIPTAKKIFNLEIGGQKVPLIRVEPAVDIESEFYLSFAVSRERNCILLTVGREGGVDIESLGEENLMVQEIGLRAGLRPSQVRTAFFHLGMHEESFPSFRNLLTSLFKSVLDNGLLLAEINPLVQTPCKELIALDGKVEVDDNFVDIHKDMEHYYQPEHASKAENTARDAGLSFVKLPGWVGLVVNGAGLAMATMDLLNYSKLPASNFLDLGGGADEERMRTALQLLFEDPENHAIFINLFGGILSCEKVAKALISVLSGNEPKKPIVARMSGKDAEQALAILNRLDSKKLHVARDMNDALTILATFKPKSSPRIDFPDPMKGDRISLDSTHEIVLETGFSLNKNSPILVQGITGHEGRLHTQLMQEYGANIVAGVTPFKGGQSVLGVPVYNSIAEAMKLHRVEVSIIFVPPRMAADAIIEAAANKVPWAICITEGIVQHEMIAVFSKVRNSPTRIIGPNTPGLIIPGETKIGILPTQPFSPGSVAVLSRSGTLTYEVAQRLTDAGIGQSLCLGVGGDPFIGTTFVDVCELLKNHSPTKAIVVLGEIGGTAEENLARYVQQTGFNKPIISFVAGQTAPPGRRLGHAGAILETSSGIQSKLQIMAQSGFIVCESLEVIPELTAKALADI